MVLSLSGAAGAAACSDDESAGGVGGSSAGSSGSGGMASGGSNGGAGAGASGSSGAGGAAGSSGAGGSGEPDAGSDAAAVAFVLTSPAFDDDPGCGPDESERDACDLFPVENTGLGDEPNNVSPELDWTGAPATTESFAIVLHDLVYAPGGDPFTHWVLWNIPASETGLPANLPREGSPGVPSDETRQVSYLADNGFAGSGQCGNVYELVLFALSVPSFEPSSDDPDAVEEEIVDSGEVLGTATLRARSNPDGPCN